MNRVVFQQVLMTRLTSSIALYYKRQKDPTAPSLIISDLSAHIENGGWYVSISRYRKAIAQGKEVVLSAKNGDLLLALIDIATQWCHKIEDARLLTFIHEFEQNKSETTQDHLPRVLVAEIGRSADVLRTARPAFRFTFRLGSFINIDFHA